MKKQVYRILEIENKAGGKRYLAQVKLSGFFGFFIEWRYVIYYDRLQHLFVDDTPFPYDEFCNAVNAIKYHKMFGNDEDVTIIHEINN